MVSIVSLELLKDKEVREEINRHKWIESEKLGYDIGFDKAAEDWLNRYSQQWLKEHQSPSMKISRGFKQLIKDKKS